ncbi:hypothetical protein [uncultured Aquitalea sp.]|uniref:hypothetical protein n=1 Tax=uncultured Aquitalea sp. TaxID=540272 RepID=UPI0025FEE8CE|nr:hypothetical protein [uncultured Aquitalea sp.]
MIFLLSKYTCFGEKSDPSANLASLVSNGMAGANRPNPAMNAAGRQGPHNESLMSDATSKTGSVGRRHVSSPAAFPAAVFVS